MKSMIAHGVLAALGLLLAWQVWTGGETPEGSEDMVELLECSAVDSIEYKGRRRLLTLERKRDDGDTFHWLTVADVPENQVTESSDGDEPRHYLVAEGEETEAWLDRYAPFKALRSLGEVEDELLEELELSDESDTITVKCGDDSGVFRIGGATFGAQGSRYVQAEDGGPVFLVEADLINKMRGAEAELVQRQLHQFEASDVAKLEISGSEASITLLQRDRNDEQAAVWVDAANPERRNDLFGNWMSRVNALTASSYLGLGSEPGSELDEPSGEKVEVLSLRYLDEEDDEIGRLAVVRVGEESATYYGQTETSRAWVRLPGSVARQVENDGRLVLGLDPLPESTTTAPDAPPPSTTPQLPPSHPPIPH